MVSQSHAEYFSCRNCNAKYLLIRVEAEPEPSHSRTECHHCGQNRFNKLNGSWPRCAGPRRG